MFEQNNANTINLFVYSLNIRKCHELFSFHLTAVSVEQTTPSTRIQWTCLERLILKYVCHLQTQLHFYHVFTLKASCNPLCSMQGSKHRRTDRSVLCCLRKAEAGKSWPRLTKDKTKVTIHRLAVQVQTCYKPDIANLIVYK